MSFRNPLGRKLDEVSAAQAETGNQVIDPMPNSLPFNSEEEALEESTALRTIGWVSAGLGAVALGLVVGRELRQRYKFNRRTPYDFYSHSGDEASEIEFGVGT
jgi:hypothetical protein